MRLVHLLLSDVLRIMHVSLLLQLTGLSLASTAVYSLNNDVMGLISVSDAFVLPSLICHTYGVYLEGCIPFTPTDSCPQAEFNALSMPPNMDLMPIFSVELTLVAGWPGYFFWFPLIYPWLVCLLMSPMQVQQFLL